MTIIIFPRSGIALTSILTSVTLGLSGCQTLPDVASATEQPSDCETGNVSANCLLHSAASAFSEIDNDAHWINAAAEYAVALHVNGEDQVARKYLEQAAEKVKLLDGVQSQISAAAEVGKSAAEAGQDDIASGLMDWGESQAEKLEENAKKYDLLGKLASVRAAIGEAGLALSKVQAFPETSDNHSSFKARTYREIAVHQAKAGNFDAAEETIARMTMGLTYYQSTARSDVALLALEVGDQKRAMKLTREADVIARAQDNGYFFAGALRDIGVVYARAGEKDKASQFFEDAKAGARTGNSNQERARALSRIATSLADIKLYTDTGAIFAEALTFAKQAKSPLFENFCNYEIAGSAAFAGEFDTANGLAAILPETKFGSTSSLRAVTQRDIAWGLAKHGRLKDAHQLIQTISPARERIMAISRVVRLLKYPDMEAFPRYL
ncbi:hypothetical protein [Parasphingorhabdus sp.]|uniref:hypothetical protein n=1 Tax=Parasphingorhabdus sp. TaxID=2709688 RepID=UPI003262EAFD